MMNKVVVVSTTDNPDYAFYAPFVERAWNLLGWNLCIMVTPDVNVKNIKVNNPSTIFCKLPNIEGVRSATIAQAGRLYAANYLQSDTLIMTSDMDLIPLSDYWHPKENEITVYGHDLTDYQQIPMGYTCMPVAKWKEVMKLNDATANEMERDFKETGDAYSEDWLKWWGVDWWMLTQRLKPFWNQINFVKRGRRLTGTYAYGRIDRGDSMKIPPNENLVDIHAENNNVRHPLKYDHFINIYKNHFGVIPNH